MQPYQKLVWLPKLIYVIGFIDINTMSTVKKLKTFFSNFSWSGRTVSYILATLAIFISVEIFNSFIPYDGPNCSFTHFYRLADAALLALPIAFIRRKWFVIPYSLYTTPQNSTGVNNNLTCLLNSR
jgi:hypothetical protein